MQPERSSELNRSTNETDIKLKLSIDGKGEYKVDSGVPFLDHMLSLFAKHGGFDLELQARGDLQVDFHHTVEDIGICLGTAWNACLGDKKGIARFGHVITPMDEALILIAADISGRGFLAFDAEFPSQRVGEFDTGLVEEFLRALAFNGKFTLHVRQLAGRNSHHIIEAIFKGLGRVLNRSAVVENHHSLPSTKGVL